MLAWAGLAVPILLAIPPHKLENPPEQTPYATAKPRRPLGESPARPQTRRTAAEEERAELATSGSVSLGESDRAPKSRRETMAAAGRW